MHFFEIEFPTKRSRSCHRHERGTAKDAQPTSVDAVHLSRRLADHPTVLRVRFFALPWSGERNTCFVLVSWRGKEFLS